MHRLRWRGTTFPSRKMKLFSRFTLCVRVANLLSPVQLIVTPWAVARQAPLSMEFSRQEYWSGLPCPPPGDLSDPGMV